jgi:hypothetical protein
MASTGPLGREVRGGVCVSATDILDPLLGQVSWEFVEFEPKKLLNGKSCTRTKARISSNLGDNQPLGG